MKADNDLFLTFYGDDFTGSTDVMESLALNGVPTALFLQPPTQEEVNQFRLKNTVSGEQRQLKAFGVAGISRSLSPAEMDRELRPIFEQISQHESSFFHYKTCSTFDSSPQVGSIGHAADLAFRYFPSDFIPLLIGAPSLNRFCIFGNLFARVDGVTYRLDRHPTMSRHPVTPMHESDIALHLSHQTDRPCHLLDLFALEGSNEEAEEKINQYKERQGSFTLFDTYNSQHLLRAGELISKHSQKERQLIVGSSGIEYALCQHLQQKGELTQPPPPISPGNAEPIIVVGGSCSPGTAQQLSWAIQQDFADLKLDAPALLEPASAEREKDRVRAQMLEAMDKKQSLVLYTALGPDDESIDKTNQKMQELSITDTPSSALLAGAQGSLVKEVLEKCGKKRVVVAGGDTSGYVARALGIYALETLMPIAPGAPLCTAHSHNSAFDGLEICLKGGQNGKIDFFGSIQMGKDIS